MSLSKDEKGENKRPNIFERTLAAYLRALQEKPILTKALTSGTVSGFGNFLSQCIVPNPQNGGKIAWRSVLAYASFGFVVSGPVIHNFYIMMDKVVPKRKDSGTTDMIKRVIFDRFIFTPPFILLFLYVVTILEGMGHEAAIKKIKEGFFTILIMNWKIWTPLQFININFVPQKYRVLYGNAVALVWSVVIANKRRQLALQGSA